MALVERTTAKPQGEAVDQTMAACANQQRNNRQLNSSAPWNVPAGQGYTNIDSVVEKYQKEANEAQEKKMQQLKENKVPAEQPLEPLVKMTGGSPQ